jgi:hypothetical protein
VASWVLTCLHLLFILRQSLFDDVDAGYATIDESGISAAEGHPTVIYKTLFAISIYAFIWVN